MLRLLRGPLSKQSYRRYNLILRDAGRELVEVRDTKVAVDTFDALMTRLTISKSNALSPFQTYLKREHLNARRQLKSKQLLFWSPKLQGVIKNIQRINKVNADDTVTNIKRAYKKMQKSFAIAHQSATDVALHELRKQSKCLASQLEILNFSSKKLQRYIKCIRKMAKHLGRDRDLVLLSANLASFKSLTRNTPSSTALEALLKTMRQQHRKLTKKSIKAAKKLSAYKARKIAHMVGAQLVQS